MARDYDVIVAGAGPAGLTSAKSASENGSEVLLLELQAQIGLTHTSVWVSSNFLEEDWERAVESSVDKVVLHSVHHDLEIEGDFGKIIDRETLEELLAYEAARAGVEVWVGSPVTDLLKDKEGVKGVRMEVGKWAEEIESEAVIDATGATEWSSLFLRKILGSDWEEKKINRTNEYLMANVSGEGRIDLYFNSTLAPMGHAWIYPLDQKFSMVGIRGVGIHPDSALDEFIGRESPSRLDEGTPIGAYRGSIPIENLSERTADDGILAVGASACQIYPFSAHGMEFAIEAGQLAGEIVAEGIKEGDTSREKLDEYDRLWRSKFENKIKVGELLREVWEISPDQKMDALLDLLEGNPELQKSFINIFRGQELEGSLKTFFKAERAKELFGKERVNRIISLYS